MKIERTVVITQALVITTDSGNPVRMYNVDSDKVDRLLVPKWAKFVAFDFDGECYAYEREPVRTKNQWKPDTTCEMAFIGSVDRGAMGAAWADSLIEIKPIPGV